MKILYISCHCVLEYDELRILNDLGHTVFSIGAYITPRRPHVNTRPPLDIPDNKDLLDKYNNMIRGNLNKKKLSNEFLDNFDCIMIMHNTDWLEQNLDTFKNRVVIVRTIGQNVWNNEVRLTTYKDMLGIKILRYSPMESNIQNYAGEDGIIRFLKYESDFKIRENSEKRVISFGQNVKQRGPHCGYSYMEYIAKNIDFKLYGPSNEDSSFSGGRVLYSEQLDLFAKCSAYFYTGTYPAQYVLNFMEAMLSGIPLVSIGRKLADDLIVPFNFEVPNILDKEGLLYYDDLHIIIDRLHKLLDDPIYNKEISDKQIKLARELFSVEKNKHQWTDFLNKI